MSAVVKQSREIYRLLIKLYPSTLQRQFAAEMLDVFEEQLADAWSEKGVSGFARVWGCVMAEVLNGPAAQGVLKTVFGVPGASLLSSSALFLLFFWASGLANVCR
jgi:hypothetical protein